MRLLYIICLLILTCTTPLAGVSEKLNVVINSDSFNKELTQAQIRNIFLGTPLLKGVKPVQLEQGHPVRKAFNAKVIGMTESRISAYWAQMRFSGTRQPPFEAKSIDEVLKLLQQDQKIIAYIPENTPLPEGTIILVSL
ncbi:MAG: hypothetical protein GJ680_02920 [Alteromonadaceae bacterium]|nr:hypothetical protein [Alteromonadaceae bacterium]